MNDTLPIYSSGDHVRLISDPRRNGIITGKTKIGRHGRGHRFQVHFVAERSSSYVPQEQLELMPATPEGPLELLQQGKLSGASDLRRTLTHARLSGKLADVIYSMEVTNTEFHAFQFKPVLRFLMSPTNSLLIADEVGLGKTIEACLIWTELRSRFDYRRLVILCPAVLREKWKMELKKRIGVIARIVDAEQLHQTLRDPGSQVEGFALICSQQGARPNKDWKDTESPNSAARLARFLDEKQYETPTIDLLVIDEAHYLRNLESQTHEMGQLFRQVSESLVMLSATPIHNRNDDLFSLLRLLDSETFTQLDDLTRILNASRPLVKARDILLGPSPTDTAVLGYLDEALRNPLLRRSKQLKQIRAEANDTGVPENNDKRARMAWRLEQVNPMAYVITRTRKRDVTEIRVVRDPIPERVNMHRTERKTYDAVTQAVLRYARGSVGPNTFLLATPQRQLSSSVAATITAWQRRANMGDDDAGYSGEKREELGPLATHLQELAHTFGDVSELREVDSKYALIKERLSDYFEDHPTEQVVLFSTFRETLNYLHERLKQDNFRTIVLHGKTKLTKDEVLTKFREKEAQILLSSEVGSEGIDLQFCRLLINYDLPWNPMRVEQRIGRLDRIGQKATKIRIWNLFYADTIDDRIYERLYEKLDLCRDALGDFEEVLGQEISRMTRDLLADELTAEQQLARIEQTSQSLANLKQEQNNLETEAAHLVAYGDYILNEVQAAKELNRWVTGSDLINYVTDFFGPHYPGCEFIEPEPGSREWNVILSDKARDDLADFAKRHHMSPGRLAQNSREPVRCRFENRTANAESPGVEEISQFHPLIRFVNEKLKTEQEVLSPAVAVYIKKRADNFHLANGIYVLCVHRWYVNGLQDIERIAFAGAILDASSPELCTRLSSDDAERLAAACIRNGKTWREADSYLNRDLVVELADDYLFAALENDFEDFVRDEDSRNQDRREIRLNNIQLHRDKKLNQLNLTLAKHQRSGNAGLVKITENKIQNLKSLVERQIGRIQTKAEISSSHDEVLLAIVQVET